MPLLQRAQRRCGTHGHGTENGWCAKTKSHQGEGDLVTRPIHPQLLQESVQQGSARWDGMGMGGTTSARTRTPFKSRSSFAQAPETLEVSACQNPSAQSQSLLTPIEERGGW